MILTRSLLVTLLGATLGTAWVGTQVGSAPEFNHLYVFLDSTTYDALARSPFAADSLGTLREATVSDGDQRWSAMYLFGKRTYVEFYRAGSGTAAPGTTAIAFGSDTPTGLDAMEARLRARFGDRVQRRERRRVQEGGEIPWFDQVELAPGADETPSRLRWWTMAYDARHLAARYPGDATLRGRTDRAAYLSRVFDPQKAVRDVRSVTLALPPAEIDALVAEWEAMGQPVRRGDTGAQARVGDVTLELRNTTSGRLGLRSMAWSLHAASRVPGVRATGDYLLRVENDTSATLALDERCAHERQVVMTQEGPIATCRGGERGPLVVFESGLGDGMTAWRDVMDSVAPFARVLAYDRAGLGASPPAPGMGNPIRAVDQLADLIARSGEGEPVVIVGHSLGGVLAQVFAHRHPDRVRGLVLVDPTPGGFFDSLRVITGAEQYDESQRRREAALRGAPLEEWRRIGAALHAADSAGSVGGRPVRILSAGRIENPDTTVGPRAKAVWLRLHQRMASRLGGTQLTVPNSGHYIQRFRPDVVVDAIRDVVRSSSRD